MTIVHIWGAHDLTGHASVETHRRYLSFHPMKRDPKYKAEIAGTPARLATFDEDYAYSGRPVESVKIDWLRENLIDDRVDDISDGVQNETIMYSLFNFNCARVSADLLFAGAKIHFDSHKTMERLWSEVQRAPFRHDHGRVTELAREMVEDVVLFCGRRGKLSPLAATIASVVIAADFTTRVFCWTPGDVGRLARDFAAKNHKH